MDRDLAVVVEGREEAAPVALVGPGVVAELLAEHLAVAGCSEAVEAVEAAGAEG